MQFGTCLFTDEREQILQKRHFYKRNDIEVSYKFPTSRQAVTWQVAKFKQLQAKKKKKKQV